MKIDGACHCGNITFAADIDQLTPSGQYYCASAQEWVQELSAVSRL